MYVIYLHIYIYIYIYKYSLNQEVASRWMSLKRESTWTVGTINKCYIYCFSLK